jgi:hypothetical protein
LSLTKLATEQELENSAFPQEGISLRGESWLELR